MSAPDPATSYEPFTVGARLRIGPPDARGVPAGADGRVNLVVARGAFGSGEHETTTSCLELLEELATNGELDGATVLDLGAGTGILAIAALKLGASRAVLVDTDDRAAAAARHHLALNKVGDRAIVVEGELSAAAGGAFDLALANIHGDLLLRLAGDLCTRLRPQAWLVLSGILWEHNWDVRERYASFGCTVQRNRFLEEYSSLLLRRDGLIAGEPSPEE